MVSRSPVASARSIDSRVSRIPAAAGSLGFSGNTSKM